MQCLSCKNDVPNREVKFALSLYLCPGCAEMAKKAEKELEVEAARALSVAKSTLAEHIMKGGLARPGYEAEEITSRHRVVKDGT